MSRERGQVPVGPSRASQDREHCLLTVILCCFLPDLLKSSLVNQCHDSASRQAKDTGSRICHPEGCSGWTPTEGRRDQQQNTGAILLSSGTGLGTAVG